MASKVDGFPAPDIRVLATKKIVNLTHFDAKTFRLLSCGYLRMHGVNPKDVGAIIGKYINDSHCFVGFNKKSDKYEHSNWAMCLFYPELVYLQLTIAENTQKFVKYKHIRIEFEDIVCKHKDYSQYDGYYMQCGVIGIPKPNIPFNEFDKKLANIFGNLEYTNCTFYNISKQDKIFNNCQTYYLHCTVNSILNNNVTRVWCSIGKDNIYNYVTLVDTDIKSIGSSNDINRLKFNKGDWIDICVEFIENENQWVLLFMKNSKYVIGEQWIELDCENYYYYAGLVSIGCNCKNCVGFEYSVHIKQHDRAPIQYENDFNYDY